MNRLFMFPVLMYIFCSFIDPETIMRTKAQFHPLDFMTEAVSLFHNMNKYETWQMRLKEDAKKGRQLAAFFYIATGNFKIDVFDPVICDAAGRYGLDPFLLKALIAVESNFNPLAVSHRGAMGLTQLMPATAQMLEVKNPFDATENINGGARHLSGLLRRYKSLHNALSFYYAGNLWRSKPSIGKPYISKVMAKYEEIRRKSDFVF